MKVNWSDKALAVRRKKYAEDPEYRAYTLRYSALRRYKMTPEEYDKKLAEQDGHCALCNTVAGNKSLHVDHSHTCCPKEKGKFHCGKCNRGLLCSHCNIKIGYLEKFLDMGSLVALPGTWLSKALKYLTQYSTQETQ